MLALVSSELKLHWAKGNLLKTVFFFSGIYTETVWISLGMVRIFLLIIEEKKKELSVVVFTSWYVQSGSTALETRCIWFMLCITKQKEKT